MQMDTIRIKTEQYILKLAYECILAEETWVTQGIVGVTNTHEV
jgi:hypothetical protein